MILLASKEYESYLNQTNCQIKKKKNEEKYTTAKNYCNVKEHCHLTCNYRGAAHSI